jgi:hypothetical protein
LTLSCIAFVCAETVTLARFEGGSWKVWKSIILPNQPLSLHRHEHGRALIALKGGTLKAVDEATPTSGSAREDARQVAE